MHESRPARQHFLWFTSRCTLLKMAVAFRWRREGLCVKRTCESCPMHTVQRWTDASVHANTHAGIGFTCTCIRSPASCKEVERSLKRTSILTWMTAAFSFMDGCTTCTQKSRRAVRFILAARDRSAGNISLSSRIANVLYAQATGPTRERRKRLKLVTTGTCCRYLVSFLLVSL